MSVARRRTRLAGDDHRSDARERAMSLLYEAESKGVPAEEVLAAQVSDPDALTRELVRGVAAQLGAIDTTIAEHAHGWSLARMPAIDRNVLRLATFELRSRPAVPVAVVIDEAVELVKRFSTDDSGRFVNGVLSSIAREARAPQAELPD